MGVEVTMRGPAAATKAVVVNGKSRYLPGADTVVLPDDVPALVAIGWQVIRTRYFATGESADKLAKRLTTGDTTDTLRKMIDRAYSGLSEVRNRLDHLEKMDAIWAGGRS